MHLLERPQQRGDHQPRHPAIELSVGDARVVALAELVVEVGMGHRVEEPRQQAPVVGENVAVVEPHHRTAGRGLHVARAEPDVAPLAGLPGREAVLLQLGIQGAQPRAIVPQDAMALGQPGEELPGVQELLAVGPVEPDHHLGQVGHLGQGLDDVGERRPLQLREERRQDQAHGPTTAELAELRLQRRHRAAGEAVEVGDDAVLMEVTHTAAPSPASTVSRSAAGITRRSARPHQ